MNKRLEAIREHAQEAKQHNKDIVLIDGIPIAQNIADSYGGISHMNGQFLKDMELFSKLDSIIKQDTSIAEDVKLLERYRMFRVGTLANKGIFYVDNKYDLLQDYPFLRDSSMPMYSNDVLTKRYLYPIRLMSGQIISYMGYYIPEDGEDPNSYEPYEVPNVSWIKQSRLIGNLESLSKYPSNPLKLLFVVEGLTDAWRIEETFHMPAICLFGSTLYKLKVALLSRLKLMGYYLIYVYDRDVAGKKPRLLKHPIWDNLMTFPEEKDIDFYVSWYYKYKIPKEDKTHDFDIPINDNYITDLLKTFKLHRELNMVYGTDLATYILQHW